MGIAGSDKNSIHVDRPHFNPSCSSIRSSPHTPSLGTKARLTACRTGIHSGSDNSSTGIRVGITECLLHQFVPQRVRCRLLTLGRHSIGSGPVWWVVQTRTGSRNASYSPQCLPITVNSGSNPGIRLRLLVPPDDDLKLFFSCLSLTRLSARLGRI